MEQVLSQKFCTRTQRRRGLQAQQRYDVLVENKVYTRSMKVNYNLIVRLDLQRVSHVVTLTIASIETKFYRQHNHYSYSPQYLATHGETEASQRIYN